LTGVEYRVLGSVHLFDGEGRIHTPRGPKQRLLVAALLHEAPRIATADRLIDTLWPRTAPEDPGAALRTQISRLRSFLAGAGVVADVLRSEPYGYRLEVDPAAVDAGRFEALLDQASGATDPGERLGLIEQALGLWRGDPFEEFADLQVFLPEVTRLRELRAGARERQVESLLASGRTNEALAAAERLVGEDPLRERPRALLMTALYESGRQHEALSTFQDYRRALSEELGLDPSPVLRQLEAEILRHEHARLSPQAAVPASHARPPLPLTRLIGREHELTSVERLLDSGRMLTLVGPGGSGKTRLALEVAGQSRDGSSGGVAWVGLEGLTDPQLLAQEVAAVLGIREHQGQKPEENLLRALGPRKLLLCLDNCEHLVDACAGLVETLLGSCPDLSILATSREPLGVRGELTWPVPPLPVPGEEVNDPAALRELAAVQLLVERATANDPAFELTPDNAAAVAQLCRRLDGIPLALELAAARLRAMSVEQLVSRLDRRFHLLTAGNRTALPRHQTLRAAIDWSYQLLPEPERRLLDRLSIFVGGFSLDAVEAVCGPEDQDATDVLDLFMALVDKSLVVPPGDHAGARYRLLETIREYAREKLAARRDSDDVHRRHAELFVGLAEEAEPHLLGSLRKEWLARLAEDQDNLRASLSWTGGQPTAATLHQRGVAALWWFWHARGQLTEARTRLDRALDLRPSASPDPVLANLLFGAAMAAWVSGDLVGATAKADRALEVARKVGDPRCLARALAVSAWVLRDSGDLAAATVVVDECADVARTGGLTPTDLAFSLWVQGSVHYTAGNLDISRTTQEESVELWRAEGVSWGLSQVLHGLAIMALTQGELDTAARLCREAIAELRGAGDVYWTCRGLEGLAAVLARQGETTRAAHLLGSAEAHRESVAAPLLAFETSRYEGTVALLREAMTETGLTSAWAAGRAWSLDDAMAYALAQEAPAG
jgi:predicted ATPase/DNA-binding SARP family transcriptional activator